MAETKSVHSINSEKIITLDDIIKNPKVEYYIQIMDDYMSKKGYTEHGLRHSKVVAKNAKDLMLRLNRDHRKAELSAIAGYLHDIGNMINRDVHAETGAVISSQILTEMGMKYEEIALIIRAIGNHHEEDGLPVDDISAGLIIADKADVHRSRVRNPSMITYDMHDRVNYAATKSSIIVNPKEKLISLDIIIDTNISSIMDYFEIFLDRMLMSRRAASVLGCKYI